MFARLRDGRNAAGEAVTWREDENPDCSGQHHLPLIGSLSRPKQTVPRRTNLVDLPAGDSAKGLVDRSMTTTERVFGISDDAGHALMRQGHAASTFPATISALPSTRARSQIGWRTRVVEAIVTGQPGFRADSARCRCPRLPRCRRAWDGRGGRRLRPGRHQHHPSRVRRFLCGFCAGGGPMIAKSLIEWWA